MSDDSTTQAKKTGRPKKADGPRVPYQQVDRILVFGELVDSGDGKEPTVAHRRLIAARVSPKIVLNVVRMGEKMKARPGGYTRVIKLGERKSDSARLAILEAVE